MADSASQPPALQPLAAAKPRRRWFQYSLRTMMIGVTLLCVWLAIVADSAEKQRRAVATIERLGGSVAYDYKFDAKGRFDPFAEPPGPNWLRQRMGIDYFATVVEVKLESSQVTDAELAHLKELKQLNSLTLIWASTTDDLEYLKELKQLKDLEIYCTPITDAGLEHLKGLSQLKSLGLVGTDITDAGLAHLKGLTQLTQLDLGCNKITDAGLANLMGLTQLRTLCLPQTHVTDAGVIDLQKALPNVNIYR